MLALDHLVYAVRDLDEGIERIGAVLGVRPASGGRHPAWGTRNALLALGPRSYLEVVAPDPAAAAHGPHPFGVDDPRTPFLSTWAVATEDIGRATADASRAGVDLGAIQSGSRRRDDGVLLAWRLTDPTTPRHDGLVPFLIEWGSTPHPAATAPGGCRLRSLEGQHPDAERLGSMLQRAGVDLHLRAGPAPALVATIESPRGLVELR